MKETIFPIPAPLGPTANLVKFSWEGMRPKETFSIVAGLHGDQLNSIYLCSQLIQFLDAVAKGIEPGYRLKGRVQVIPAVNLLALQEGTRLWSFDDLDMNLTFPGNAQGELAEQIADAVFKHTVDSQYGIVLHTAADHYEDAPHLVCLNPDSVTKGLAQSLGPKIARKPEESPAFRLSLYYRWINQGIKAVIVSAGKPRQLNRPLCKALFSGLVNALLWARVLTCNQKKPRKHKVEFFDSGCEQLLHAGTAGLFMPMAKPGASFKKGEKVGEVVDLYTGITLDSPVASADGYLVTLRDYPIVYQKEPLAVLLGKRKFRFWPF